MGATGPDPGAATDAPGDWAGVGRILRPHGLRGEVVVLPLTDFPQARFEPGSRLFVRMREEVRPFVVRTCRFHKGRPLVSFEGVETMSEAESLASAELLVPAAELMSLPPGTFYQHDLVGCLAEDAAGAVVGPVVRVDDQGGLWLVIDGHAGEVLVPFAADLCPVVDVAGKRIVLNLPDGLVELNAAKAGGAGQRDRGR